MVVGWLHDWRLWKRSSLYFLIMKIAFIGGACLLIAVLAGAAYYATHRIPYVDHRTWVQAGYTDANGKFVKTGEFREADPDIFKTDGMSHLTEYAEMMVDPKTPEASLIVGSLDGKKGALFMRDGRDLTVMEDITLAPPSDADPKHGRKVRKFFKELRIKEKLDRIHDYNGVHDAMEDLEYSIGHDEKFAATVMGRILLELSGVNRAEGLSFRYERERPAQQKGANVFMWEGR